MTARGVRAPGGRRGWGARVASLCGLCAAALGAGAAGACGVRDVVTERTRGSGLSGWFRVDAAFSGATDDEDAWEARFEKVPIGRYSPPCDWIAKGLVAPAAGAPASASAGPSSGAVWVLVHGILGDGSEWYAVLPEIAAARPASVYMNRWQNYEHWPVLSEALAGGVSRLGRCLAETRGGGEVIVLAHSAGGVVAARAAAAMTVPESVAVRVYTIASPLAGTGERGRVLGGKADERAFMLELGGVISTYPAAAPRVAVSHLRTSYPADTVMKPNRKGHAPNERGVGVSGAREIDLPATLTHDGALVWATREIAAGRL